MPFTLPRTLEILERTPAVLRAWVVGLDPAWTHEPYGPGTWSVYNVVGHLIAVERKDWIPRVRIILEHGPDRPFDPVAHDATLRPEQGPSLPELVEQFAALRRESLRSLRSMGLGPEHLPREGTHPAFGRVRLGQLLATWAVHDTHHLAQIAKAMVYQYRDEVGPWRAYINTLPRDDAQKKG